MKFPALLKGTKRDILKWNMTISGGVLLDCTDVGKLWNNLTVGSRYSRRYKRRGKLKSADRYLCRMQLEIRTFLG